MTIYKDLYLANNLSALHILALKSDFKNKKPDMIKKAAKNLYANSQSDPLDEERTYILLVRFLQLFDHLKNIRNDENFVNLMFGSDVRKAKAQLADLTNNLTNRYAEKNLLEINNKTEEVVVTPEPPPQTDEKTAKVFNDENFITCQQLFSALTNPNVNILILDARPADDFSRSKVKDVKCINIPENTITSGLSAHRLGIVLPPESKEQWERRDSFDAIVLMDWDTSSENFLSSKIDKLKTILVEWDFNRNYKELPTVLNGGYLEFLQTYPMLCSDPHVVHNKANSDLDELLQLDVVVYPTDMEVELTIESKIDPEPVRTGPYNCNTREEVLLGQKELALQKRNIEEELLVNEKNWLRIYKLLNANPDSINKQELLKERAAAEKVLEKLVLDHGSTVAQQRHLSDQINMTISFEPGKTQPDHDVEVLQDINEIDTEYMKLHKIRYGLTSDRGKICEDEELIKKGIKPNDTSVADSKLAEPNSTKIVTTPKKKPTVDRRTKPKKEQQTRHMEMFHMKGNLQSMQTWGITALKNIRNTCYMNTILQCFRHIPDMVRFFCRGAGYEAMTRSMPTLMPEVICLVRTMWASTYSVITPTEFYDKLISVAPTYGEGHHEDCMEFFMSLFNYLSDDCSNDISSYNKYSYCQKAWFEQHHGKTSFFIRKFYHQIKIDHECMKCNERGVKFEIENMLMLPVPQYNFKLQNLVDNYLDDYVIEDYCCSKCKGAVKAKKSMCYYPANLVIVLKRYVPDLKRNGTVQYRRNNYECDFPTENLRLANCNYNLQSIALHTGTLKSGHYTAAGLNVINNLWYEYNDSAVQPINIDDTCFKVKSYVLFYSLYKNCIKNTEEQAVHNEIANLI